MANDARSQPTVLIVDDDPIVRMIAVDFVEASGFLTVEANNADEAIAILESRSDIRSLVTDVAMPGSMDGIGLALAVHERWAPMKIVVVSGAVWPSKADLPPRSRFSAETLYRRRSGRLVGLARGALIRRARYCPRFPRTANRTASSAARKSARALSTHSFCSAAGEKS